MVCLLYSENCGGIDKWQVKTAPSHAWDCMVGKAFVTVPDSCSICKNTDSLISVSLACMIKNDHTLSSIEENTKLYTNSSFFPFPAESGASMITVATAAPWCPMILIYLASPGELVAGIGQNMSLQQVTQTYFIQPTKNGTDLVDFFSPVSKLQWKKSTQSNRTWQQAFCFTY